MSIYDFFQAIGAIVLFLCGMRTGWNMRGRYEERRATAPTITLYERPTHKPNDSKI